MKRSTKRKIQRADRRRRDRYRSPSIEAYFPAKCQECGFIAKNPNDLQQHEHENDNFVRL